MLKYVTDPFFQRDIRPKIAAGNTPFGTGQSRERTRKSLMETQMSQTVAHTLVDVLEKIGVTHIFGLIADSLNRSATPCATARSSGSAFATRKALRLPPLAKRN
jgi:hypothetical protein